MASVAVTDLFNVKDMVFVITGGGSGLGAMIAQALDKNGAAKVFILGRREAKLKEVAEAATNNHIIPVQCDISSKDSLKAAAHAVAAQTPFINAVIANSGILGPVTAFREANSTIGSIQEQLWDTFSKDTSNVFDVNVSGSFFTFVAFLKLLEAGNTHDDSRGRKDFIQSQFISISSNSGFVRNEIVSYPYSGSKAALTQMTKMIATNFATRGIRANCIAPGLFITEMTEGYFTKETDWTQKGSFGDHSHPMTRAGAAEDIAGAALFLTSRAGGYVNGMVLVVDGGETCVEPSTY